jgi:hypothetical protein
LLSKEKKYSKIFLLKKNIKKVARKKNIGKKKKKYKYWESSLATLNLLSIFLCKLLIIAWPQPKSSNEK